MGLCCALGLLGGLFLAFVGVSLGVSQGVSLRVRLARRLGGGFALALANTVQVFLGTLGGGKEEATGHLRALGVVWVFHPDDPYFSPMDTGDGARLHACGVRVVDFGTDGGSSAPSPPLGGGGFSWGRGWPLCPGGGGLGGGRFLLLLGGVAPSNENAIWGFSCH